MSKPLSFNTPVDTYVRKSGMTRKEFSRRAWLSTSTLMKARALDRRRGNIHWTSLVLIGIQMGIIDYGEAVGEDDPRLHRLAGTLVGARGRGAPRFEELPPVVKQRPSHLRLVA